MKKEKDNNSTAFFCYDEPQYDTYSPNFKPRRIPIGNLQSEAKLLLWDDDDGADDYIGYVDLKRLRSGKYEKPINLGYEGQKKHAKPRKGRTPMVSFTIEENPTFTGLTYFNMFHAMPEFQLTSSDNNFKIELPPIDGIEGLVLLFEFSLFADTFSEYIDIWLLETKERVFEGKNHYVELRIDESYEHDDDLYQHTKNGNMHGIDYHIGHCMERVEDTNNILECLTIFTAEVFPVFNNRLETFLMRFNWYEKSCGSYEKAKSNCVDIEYNDKIETIYFPIEDESVIYVMRYSMFDECHDYIGLTNKGMENCYVVTVIHDTEPAVGINYNAFFPGYKTIDETKGTSFFSRNDNRKEKFDMNINISKYETCLYTTLSSVLNNILSRCPGMNV